MLVGAGARQRRFTVHHEIITNRSKFFRAARPERSTSDESKPVDLQHCDPDIFAYYLHCVYRDAVPYFDIFNDGDEGNDTYTMEVIREDPDAADQYYEYLMKLYTIADRLQDPITANMVIDEVRRISQKACLPQTDALGHAFDHTLPGDKMRKVLADMFIFSGDELLGVSYPAKFLRLVVKRFKLMRATNSEVGNAATKVGEETLWALGDDDRGHQARREYHQEIEEDSKPEEGSEMKEDSETREGQEGVSE